MVKLILDETLSDVRLISIYSEAKEVILFYGVLHYLAGKLESNKFISVLEIEDQVSSDNIDKSKQIIVPYRWYKAIYYEGMKTMDFSYKRNTKNELRIFSDRQFLMEAVNPKRRPGVDQQIPQEFVNDRELFLKLVKWSGYSLKYAGQLLISDREVVEEAVKNWGVALDFASEDLKQDRTLMMLAVNRGYSKAKLTNEEITVEVLQKDRAYLYQFTEIPFEKNLIIQCLKIDTPFTLSKITGSEYKNDKDIISTILEFGDGMYFKENPLCLSDKTLILKSLKRGTEILEYLPKEFLCDRGFVLELTSINGLSLYCADKQFHTDKELLLRAVRTCPSIFSKLKVSDEIFKDLSFVVDLCKQGVQRTFILPYINLQDREMMFEICKHHHEFLQHASDNLRRDPSFILPLLKVNGECLVFANVCFRYDPEIVLESTKTFKMALKYAGRLLSSKEFVRKILQVEPCSNVVPYMDSSLLNDRDFILELVSDYQFPFSKVPKEFKKDKTIVLESIRQPHFNVYDINSVSRTLFLDYEFSLIAAQHNLNFLSFVPGFFFSNRQYTMSIGKFTGIVKLNI